MKSKSLKNSGVFPAKVLLFGEYTVLMGSSALAIPFNHYSGQWKYYSKIDPVLQDWVNKLHQLKVDLSPFLFLDEFEQAVQNGLNFKSDIPTGYGLGSSGALTAALFSQYGKDLNRLSLEELRTILAGAESCFHGKSSGIDPLISYTEKAIRFQIDTGPELVQIGEQNLDFYLINSQKPRETKTLVANFNTLLEEDANFRESMHKLGLLQDEAINTFLSGDTQRLWAIAIEISTIQLNSMYWLIPEPVKSLFEEGIKSQNFVMKLCGAGGGGYFIRINSPGFKLDTEDNKEYSDWIPITF
jgi:mevalonate kinase